MRTQFSKIALAATFGFAITLTLSCSSDDGDGGGGSDGGVGEGLIQTYGIKDIGESSFTVIGKWYDCQEENGELKEEIYEDEVSYSLNGKTLSLYGIEFNGSQTSLIGIWTREPFSASCEKNDDYCKGNNSFSKAVFTENSLSITECFGEIGEREFTFNNGVTIIEKYIDCVTAEYTKGTETVRFKASGTEVIATYKGKTCKMPFDLEPSESQMRAACEEAYNKAKTEGDYKGSYYYDILNDIEESEARGNCDGLLPEWIWGSSTSKPAEPELPTPQQVPLPPPLDIADFQDMLK
jgi:hypothetical protein